MRGYRALADRVNRDDRLSRAPVELQEFLCFLLGAEQYAVSIGVVREIVKPSPICEVPRTGPSILGVMSVRGTIVTVVDMCTYTGEGHIEMGKHSRVLLTEAQTGEIVGLAVSQVLGVIHLANKDIEPAYQTLVEASTHISAVARPEGGPMVVLLDVVSLLGTL